MDTPETVRVKFARYDENIFVLHFSSVNLTVGQDDVEGPNGECPPVSISQLLASTIFIEPRSNHCLGLPLKLIDQLTHVIVIYSDYPVKDRFMPFRLCS